MKKLFLLLIALLSFNVVLADGLSKKELKMIEKDAKKQAKEYKGQGWLTLPGSLPMERQLEESYKMKYERNNGEPAYIIKEGNTVGENYDAAKMQAVQMAKLQIAGDLESEVVALMETEVSNNQLSTEEAASISKTVTQAKGKIAQKLGRVITVMELYKKLPNKHVNVLVTLAYSSEQARKIAKKVIYEELEKDHQNLREQLDKIDW